LPLDAHERADILADTKEEIERLIRLVNQLLVLARADAWATTPSEAVPLKPLVEDACRQTQSLAPQRVIRVEVADVDVWADRDALKQVLLILLDNARVHTPPSAHIHVADAERCIAGDPHDSRYRTGHRAGGVAASL
jgi:two-component system OmpR family sensor kinase